MILERKNILFMTTAAKIGGGSKVLLAVARELLKANTCFLLVQEDCQLGEEFSRIGGKVILLKMPAWRRLRNIFTRGKVVRAIERIVQEKGIDLVCCNSYRINPYAHYVSRRKGVPLVTYVHDRLEKGHIRNFLLHKVRHLIAPSRYVRTYLDGLEDVRVIYNGIGDSAPALRGADLRRHLGLAPDAFLVGMVAHFTQNKRHAAVIDVVGKLKTMSPDIHAVFVGGNIYGAPVSEETLRRHAERLGCSDKVHFLGQREDVEDLVRQFDLFAFPCRNEAFGLSALEAMRAGVPVFVDIHSGGTLEVVRHLQDGEIVDFSDPAFVAERVMALKRDPECRRAYGEAARDRFLSGFTADVFLKKTLEMYAEVMAEERG